MGILIDAIYNGKLHVPDLRVPRNPEYWPLEEKLSDLRDSLAKTLDEKTCEQLDKYDELNLCSCSMESCTSFSLGFRLGVLLMCESMEDQANLLR